jgi:superfamily I DNA/RNA helicase/mRNA-degrading endonuclease RelE of RelBE toxin-antitoxin system
MSALANTFRVAIFDEFFEAFGGLAKAQQKKVREFLRKFRANPTDRSINYEKIHSFVDPNLRSVRIGDDYRAIVLRPETGNVYGLLWVDHHDEAMAWASKKRCTINPEIGAIQIYDLVEGEEVVQAPAPTAASKKAEPPPLFAALSDADLVGVGVPEELVPLVRSFRAKADLEQAAERLPKLAREGLDFLADGEPLEDVRVVMGLAKPPAVVVPDDFSAALEVDASRSQFVVVENDEALQAMLDAPLEKWRVFLHPSQRQLVERVWNGPVRVLGGAGTGKTVVAMHRAAWLAREVFVGERDRILFTTFTANLAEDIAQNLDKLLDGAARRRVEVLHIDAWVARFLKANGYDYEVTYWPDRPDADGAWKKALAFRAGDFTTELYREEWERVVQPQACMSAEDYAKASRAGRGTRLSRTERKAMWPVFEAYRNALEAKKLKEPVDAMRDAAALLRSRKASVPYKAVLVDEAQDIPTVGFELLRTMAPEGPNDLFIVGDGHQRIYGRQPSLSKAGIRVVGRSRRLRVNYRTTEQIRRFAVAQLEGVQIDDLDEGFDSVKGYLSLVRGPEPKVVGHRTLEKEADAIATFVKAGAPERTCLVARTADLVDKYAKALETRGLTTKKIKRGTRDDPAAPGVRLATMHRVKGLEFDRVIVAGANEGVLPLAAAVDGASDDAAREDVVHQERALFYVALTRARKEVLVTSHGAPSPWLPAAKKAKG